MINTLIVFAVSRGILTALVVKLRLSNAALIVLQHSSIRRVFGGTH